MLKFTASVEPDSVPDLSTTQDDERRRDLLLRIEELERALAQAGENRQAERDELEQDLEELRASAELERLEHRDENAALRAELDRLEERAEASARVAEATEAAREVEAREAAQRLGELEAALADSKVARAELERENVALEERVRELEEAATATGGEIADLRPRLQAAEVFFTAVERERSELEGQLASLRDENEALRQELAATEEAPAGNTEAGPAAEAGGRVEAEESIAESELEMSVVAENASTAPESASSAEATPAEAVSAEELLAVVEEWAVAWSEQRVDDYLAFYGDRFQPPNGQSRASWERQRRTRVSRPSRIEVEVAFLELRSETATRAEIDVLQSYRSDTFADVVVKTLTFAWEGGAWKIVGEQAR